MVSMFSFHHLEPVAFGLARRRGRTPSSSKPQYAEAVAELRAYPCKRIQHYRAPRTDRPGLYSTLEVRLWRLVRHIDAIARRVEFPSVVDAANTALLVATEEKARPAMACRDSSMRPTFPEVSLNPIRFSPSILTRTGSQRVGKLRRQERGKPVLPHQVPHDVPGPIRLIVSFSSTDSTASSSLY